MNWHDRLVELARADKAKDQLAALKEVRDELYRTSGLQALDAAYASISGRPDYLRSQIRDDGEKYVLLTGDKKPHDLVDVRYATKPMYDDKEALAWCIEQQPEFVKVKKSLDKRPFNAAVKDGTNSFPGAEMVTKITIAIKAVGHLLEGSES